MHLVVTEPFGGFRRGDEIHDPAAIETVLAGENAHQVVRVESVDAAPVETSPSDPVASASE